jgi:O-antigen biosynthesis protein
MLSVIVVDHNGGEYTQECINAVVSYTTDFEIIVVDNGSQPRTVDTLLPKELCKMQIVRNEINFGYPSAVNQGIKASIGETLCFLNNDCVVTPHWFDYLNDHIKDGADIVGPMTNKISGPQQTRVKMYDGADSLAVIAEEFHQKNLHKYMYFYRLVGFCFVLRRSVYDLIGGFDEEFGIGNYEDDDYCMRAIDAGLQVRMAKDVYVHHYGSMTHHMLDVDYAKLLTANRKLFFKRWEQKLKDGMLSKDKEDGYYGKERTF